MAGDLMALRAINAERRNAAVRTESSTISTEEASVKAAITRLTQIENVATPTNAQVIQAVRDIAQYLRRTIRVVIGQ